MRDEQVSEKRNTARRLVWFVALWCAGVAAVGAVAYALRFVIGA